MKEAVEGVFTYFSTRTSDQFYIAIGGRMYYKRAPQRATFPYVVYFKVGGRPEYYFSNSPVLETVSFQFSIFSKSPTATEAETILKYLKALFDSAAPSVTGWNRVSWGRSFDLPSIVDEEDGVIIQQESVQYELVLSNI